MDAKREESEKCRCRLLLEAVEEPLRPESRSPRNSGRRNPELEEEPPGPRLTLPDEDGLSPMLGRPASGRLTLPGLRDGSVEGRLRPEGICGVVDRDTLEGLREGVERFAADGICTLGRDTLDGLREGVERLMPDGIWTLGRDTLEGLREGLREGVERFMPDGICTLGREMLDGLREGVERFMDDGICGRDWLADEERCGMLGRATGAERCGMLGRDIDGLDRPDEDRPWPEEDPRLESSPPRCACTARGRAVTQTASRATAPKPRPRGKMLCFIPHYDAF